MQARIPDRGSQLATMSAKRARVEGEVERVKELEKVNKVSKRDDDNTRETQVLSDMTKIGDGTTRRETVNEKVLSWTAARAGILTIVTNQEESNVVEPMQDQEKKRKTPKEYRPAPRKIAKNREITAANKMNSKRCS